MSPLRRSILACALLLLAACNTTQKPDDSLYQALGAQPGIEQLVDAFLINLSNDPRISAQFRETKVSHFRQMLIEQFCSLSGGPCTYTGDTMAQSHAGKNITDAHFNALVEDLIDAMESRNIPVSAQNRLLVLLAPMHGDIVYH
jgi:hemoglobin